MIMISKGKEGKLHNQNIFYDVLLIMVIREWILSIIYSHTFIWKFLKMNLAPCLQMVEAKKEQHFFLMLEILTYTHTLHQGSDKW